MRKLYKTQSGIPVTIEIEEGKPLTIEVVGAEEFSTSEISDADWEKLKKNPKTYTKYKIKKL